MKIVTTRDDQNTRHIVLTGLSVRHTLCGLYALEATEVTLPLPVNCDECRTQNGQYIRAQRTQQGPENLGTIWVCQNCMLHHANGECGDCHREEGHEKEPLSDVEVPYSVAMGMAYAEHAEDCPNHFPEGADTTQAPGDVECDCETNTFSTSQCEGCGSYLHGERHAMTLFKDATA